MSPPCLHPHSPADLASVEYRGLIRIGFGGFQIRIIVDMPRNPSIFIKAPILGFAVQSSEAELHRGLNS